MLRTTRQATLAFMSLFSVMTLVMATATVNVGAQQSVPVTTQTASPVTDALVEQVTTEFLGRSATAGELEIFTQFSSEAEVRIKVLASNDFYERAGSNQRDFIIQAHRSVLGRAPLHDEYRRAASEFPSGPSREAQSLVANVQAREAVATILMFGYRTPGTTAFPDWPDKVYENQRIIANYGNHQTSRLGVLGETGPEEAVNLIKETAAQFSEPGTPAVGAFEMIVTVAQGSPGSDGNFSTPSNIDDVREWIDIAEQSGVYVILDIQPGRSDFLTESKRYEELLLRPNVGLALDPEWRLGSTGVPGETIGTVTAEEVNEVSKWLAAIVRDNDLPEKIFIVHQFQERMIQDRQDLAHRPGLALTIHVDGFGGRENKQATYSTLQIDAPFYNGFKLFIDEDTNLYQPSEVLSFTENPVPNFVSYQ